MKLNKKLIFVISLLLFIILGISNYINNNSWYIDSIFAIFVLLILIVMDKWLNLRKIDIFLVTIALIVHNLGSFNFYALKIFEIEYDNIVHFVSSVIGAFILCGIILRKYNDKIKPILLIITVISIVSTFGVFVEELEYLGCIVFGEGEGFLRVGSGDYGKFVNIESQYVDTMDDLYVNFIGSIFGVVLYYFVVAVRKRFNLNK